MSGPSGEPPADVHAVLDQLLSRAAGRATAGDAEGVHSLLGTVERVVQHKVPDRQRRERLLHGCERTRALLPGEPAAAAEHLRAMRRRLDPP